MSEPVSSSGKMPGSNPGDVGPNPAAGTNDPAFELPDGLGVAHARHLRLLPVTVQTAANVIDLQEERQRRQDEALQEALKPGRALMVTHVETDTFVLGEGQSSDGDRWVERLRRLYASCDVPEVDLSVVIEDGCEFVRASFAGVECDHTIDHPDTGRIVRAMAAQMRVDRALQVIPGGKP